MPLRPIVLLALGLALLPGRVARSQPPAAQGEKAPPARRAARTDGYGDPLPRGILARSGTVRLRQFLPGNIRFSPDGKVLVTAGQHAPTACLWHVASGKLIRSLGPPGAPGPDGFADFSPDGRTLVLPGGVPGTSSRRHDDTSISLWEVASGKERRRLPAHEWPVGPAAFAPGGRILASADGDGQLRLWDVPTGRELCRVTGHRGSIFTLAFSPDGKSLATGAYDHLAVVWDVEELVPRRAPTAGQLTPAQKGRLWGELASDQATRAYEAVWALAEHPGQVETFLQERLRAKADPGRLARLIANLDANSFDAREKASEELARLGHGAGPKGGFRPPPDPDPGPRPHRGALARLRGASSLSRVLLSPRPGA